jgi:HSP20 family protein
MNRLFEGSLPRSGQSDLATWAPAVDIFEAENELVAKVDLPGVDEKDIDIRLENNTLTMRGERKFEKSVNEDHYLRVERAYGSFTRTFSLPNTINPEGINASYKDGVLTVHMPKREESKPKQVKINVASNGK